MPAIVGFNVSSVLLMDSLLLQLPLPSRRSRQTGDIAATISPEVWDTPTRASRSPSLTPIQVANLVAMSQAILRDVDSNQIHASMLLRC